LALDELGEALKKRPAELRKALLIGDSAKRVAKEVFDRNGIDNYQVSDAKDMPTVVMEATALARPGDAVVLSPAFASFDMFNNFEERGIKFNEAVEAL
jgi:UDP-N-acetylmuramoylalanine--D-glutamate ligase